MSSKNLPLVSAIIPSYNHSQFVQEAILSIVGQDYKNLELIIIDDGSTDDSVVKISELIDICKNRFNRFEIRSRPNKGLTATLNEALDWCHGKLICPIASDDGWYSQKISTQVEFLLLNPDIPACSANVEIIGSTRQRSNYAKSKISFYEFDDIFLFKHNLPAPTLMFDKTKIKSWPIYSEEYCTEDLYLLLKIASTGQKIACLPNTLGFYRIHKKNISNLQFTKLGEDRIKILNQYCERKLWRKSVSISTLIQATQTLSIGKIAGIELMVKSIKIFTPTILTKRFIRFLIYVFMSKKTIKKKLDL